jgi:hypothetical protein
MIPVQLIDEDHKSFGVKRLDNRIEVSAKPYYDMVAEGLVPDHNYVSKFGHDSDTANADQEVWDGSAVYTYATTAETLYLSSSDDNDDQTYEVQGLDSNWNPKTETVTCTGFAGVALPGTWMRTFRIKNTGTTNNAGIIYVSTDSNTAADGVPDPITTVRAQISVGRNQTLMAIWSVPKNNTAYLTNFYASAAATTVKTTEVSLWVRPFGGVFQVKKIFSINSGTTAQLRYDFPLVIPAKSDVRITANSNASSEVSAGFDAWYEEL